MKFSCEISEQAFETLIMEVVSCQKREIRDYEILKNNTTIDDPIAYQKRLSIQKKRTEIWNELYAAFCIKL